MRRRLVAQLRAGDEAAFEQVVRAYGGRLLAVARRIVGSEEDARDVVQDAFMNAFQEPRSIRRQREAFHLAASHCRQRGVDEAADAQAQARAVDRNDAARRSSRTGITRSDSRAGMSRSTR